MAAPSPDRLVLLGVFGAPQGVRGEVRIKSYTAEAKAIGGYGPLTDATGARRFTLDALRPLKDDMLVARLAGVTTREAASRSSPAARNCRRLTPTNSITTTSSACRR